MTSSSRRSGLLAALAAGALGLAAATCATSQNPNAAKYPPRGRGCAVQVFHSAAPGVTTWDDLGIAHVDCPLDEGRVQCLERLREEACRMGGDILYDVPKKPMRPTEQGMVYAGHVAHTRASTDGGAAAEEQAADQESDAGFDETSPVQPLAPAAPLPAPPADGGARD
jgi:hypothetical protein